MNINFDNEQSTYGIRLRDQTMPPNFCRNFGTVPMLDMKTLDSRSRKGSSNLRNSINSEDFKESIEELDAMLAEFEPSLNESAKNAQVSDFYNHYCNTLPSNYCMDLNIDSLPRPDRLLLFDQQICGPPPSPPKRSPNTRLSCTQGINSSDLETSSLPQNSQTEISEGVDSTSRSVAEIIRLLTSNNEKNKISPEEEIICPVLKQQQNGKTSNTYNNPSFSSNLSLNTAKNIINNDSYFEENDCYAVPFICSTLATEVKSLSIPKPPQRTVSMLVPNNRQSSQPIISIPPPPPPPPPPPSILSKPLISNSSFSNHSFSSFTVNGKCSPLSNQVNDLVINQLKQGIVLKKVSQTSTNIPTSNINIFSNSINDCSHENSIINCNVEPVSINSSSTFNTANTISSLDCSSISLNGDSTDDFYLIQGIDIRKIEGHFELPENCPLWKRNVLYKKNQALVADFLKILHEKHMEDVRWGSVPGWKRNLLEQKIKKNENTTCSNKVLANKNHESGSLNDLPEWKKNLLLKRRLAHESNENN